MLYTTQFIILYFHKSHFENIINCFIMFFFSPPLFTQPLSPEADWRKLQNFENSIIIFIKWISIHKSQFESMIDCCDMLSSPPLPLSLSRKPSKNTKFNHHPECFWYAILLFTISAVCIGQPLNVNERYKIIRKIVFSNFCCQLNCGLIHSIGDCCPI